MTRKRTSSRGEGPTQIGGRFVHADRYVVVLGLIGITVLGNAFLGRGLPGMAFLILMLLLTLVVTLVTSRAGWGTTVLAVAVTAVLIAGGVAADLSGSLGQTRVDWQVAVMAIGLVTTCVIALRIVRHPSVSVDTVAGAAAIYLLFGLLFAVIYAFIGDLTIAFDPVMATRYAAQPTAAQAFFIASRTPLPSDFLYFSFVTLTTVGYGDLTAASQIGRMVAVIEALLGQLYLVTVVAVLVSNLKPRASKPGPATHDAAPAVPTDEAGA